MSNVNDVNYQTLLADIDKQLYIQTHLPKLSTMNRNSSILMTGPSQLSDDIYYVNTDDTYKILIDLILELCKKDKLSWHDINVFHAANLVGLEKLFNLTVVSRDV